MITGSQAILLCLGDHLFKENTSSITVGHALLNG